MNMNKSHTAKDELNQLHIDILGISNLEWPGIGHFRLEDCTVYTQDTKIKE